MKLKSLFLATLAAMAMVSCSNENDPITDNGDSAEKNAIMQFRISFGSAVNTRAEDTSGDATGEKEAGLDKEQKFSQALLIAAYENATQDVIVKTIARNEFSPVTDPASDGKYYQSTPFEVKAGNVKAYVVLNPTTTSIEGLTGKIAPAVVEKKLEALKLTTLPAAENSFVMYGAATALTEIAENTTTPVTVAVDRVVAKLKEETESDKLRASVSKNFDGVDLNTAVTVTLKNYAFTNLTDKSNLVYQSDAKVSSFVSTSVFDGTTAPSSFSYVNTLGAPDTDAQITYCWENENAETATDKGDNITSIIYKALITTTGTGHTDGENIYVYNNKAYNFTELKTELPGLKLTDNSEIADYDAIGIFKYEDGLCYYRQPILTGSNSKTIARNNVYKLKVIEIKSLGYPTPVPPTKKTMMQLYIEVNKWTVNINDFKL